MSRNKRNTIRIHFGCAGVDHTSNGDTYMNPLTREWLPLDRQTARTFVGNVLDYRSLRVGHNPHARGAAGR